MIEDDRIRDSLTRDEMDGMTYVRALRDGMMARSPMAETMGLRVVSAEKGEVAMESTPGGHVYNNRTLHGGAMATMLDSAMSAAVNTVLARGERAVTQDIRVTFLAPVTPDSGTLKIFAAIIDRRRSLALADARLTDAAGQCCAHGTATFAIRASGDGTTKR